MTFIQNMISDMREKRLLPVAIGLVAVAVAIPLVLLKDSTKPATQTSPSGTPVPGASAAGSATDSFVQSLPDDAKPSEDPLVGFNRKNPFVQQAQGVEGGKGSTTPGSGDVTSPEQGSSTGGESGDGTGGTSTTTTTEGTSENQPSEIRLYRWSVDLKFGVEGKELKSHNDLSSVTVFPSDSNPIVALIGVSETGNTAIFMLNEGVTQGGEGTCKPSKADCTYLYLREGTDENRHTVYRDPSRKYTLKLVRIELKPTGKTIDPDKVAKGSSAKSSGSKRARAGGSSAAEATPSLGTVGGKQ